jgi:hypothetical protein
MERPTRLVLSTRSNASSVELEHIAPAGPVVNPGVIDEDVQPPKRERTASKSASRPSSRKRSPALQARAGPAATPVPPRRDNLPHRPPGAGR